MNSNGIQTEDIQKEINNIKNNIKPYTTNTQLKIQNYLRYPYLYIGSPILSFCLLFIFRPFFIYKQEIVKGLKVPKFSLNQFCYSWIILSLVLLFVQYKYLKK